MSDEKIDVLIVNGVGKSGSIDVVHSNLIGKIAINTSGSCNTASFLPTDKLRISHFIIDHLEKQQISVKHILKHDIIFCEISDPDSHSMALYKARQLFDLIHGQIPWINNPHFVLNTSRSTMPGLLSQVAGVIAPKSIKLTPETVQEIGAAIEKSTISFPVLIRPTGSHGGKNLKLIESLQEIEQLDLSVYKELFVTEYVNYKQDDVFTKYRFTVVGGEPFLRHVIFNDHWNIHSESRNFMAENISYQSREEEIIKNFEKELKPRVEVIIQSIYNLIGLDYFGIDCAINNNQLVLFEVNASMNMLTNNQPLPNIWEHQIASILQKLVDDLIISRVKSHVRS